MRASNRQIQISFHKIFFITLCAFLNLNTFSKIIAQEVPPKFRHLTPEQGLSQASVLCMLRDSRGFMWFGTEDGLNRYDGMDFRVYENNPLNNNSLSGNYVRALAEDDQGRLWVGTINGLNRMDFHTGEVLRLLHESQTTRIFALHQHRGGDLWIGSSVGLFHVNPNQPEHMTHIELDIIDEDAPLLGVNAIRQIFEDRDGILWLAGNLTGLIRFDPKTGEQRFYRHEPDTQGSLSGDQITAITQDPGGDLWVATRSQGLNRLNLDTHRSQIFRHDVRMPEGLASNEIYDLEIDHRGDLWIAYVSDGLSRRDHRTGVFQHFRTAGDKDSGPSSNRLVSLYQDREYNLWIGTLDRGASKLDRSNTTFVHYAADPENPASLRSSNINTLLEDHQGVLWVGAKGGGLDIMEEPGVFRPFKPDDPTMPQALARHLIEDDEDDVWVAFFDAGLLHWDRSEDRLTSYRAGDSDLVTDWLGYIHQTVDGALWIGSFNAGAIRLNPKSGVFRHFPHRHGDPKTLASNHVTVLLEDADQRLWLGTLGGGLSRYEPREDRFFTFMADATRTDAISANEVLSLHEARDGTFWVGALNGLNLFDRDTGRFRVFQKKDGLPNNVINGIQESNDGALWLSTNQGLSRFDPRTETATNYDVYDGLQSNEFNIKAHLAGADGRLYFGGPRGLNVFFPDQIQEDRFPPQIALTEVRIANRELDPNRLILRQNRPPLLKLSHRELMITFEFAALHYARPEQNLYKYKLEGFDKTWNETTADNRIATYTSLPARPYTFRVIAANKDGLWNEEGLSIDLNVAPSPFFTPLAYFLYSLCVLFLLMLYVRHQSRKLARERHAAEHNRLVAERLRQLDKLKDAFLANTSHELRTPLHGVIGLSEALIDGSAGKVSDQQALNLQLIADCARRLNFLVSDILDFSKLKEHSLKLNREPVDLGALAHVILTLSKPLAVAKGLVLKTRIAEDTPPADADPDRLQQILHNLIDNAIKFTQKGHITLAAERRDTQVLISVSDTGVGIPADKLHRIFESFVQVNHDPESAGGTGLGLSISQKLVRLHNSELQVISTPDQGSVFSFALPIADKDAVQIAPLPLDLDVTLNALVAHDADPDGYHILIVDDDPINRQVLRNHLNAKGYRLTCEASGQAALDRLNQESVDLILLDIMMPGLSGLETCRRIRQRHNAQDLPVIFLTARDRVNDLITGFDAGANDYLTKPIAKQELLARVRGHLQIATSHRELEHKVDERTRELAEKNEEILRGQRQLVTQARMAAMGSLTAGVAHEIRNPLNFINNFSAIIDDLIKEAGDTLENNRELMNQNLYQTYHELFDNMAQNAELIGRNGERAERIVRAMVDMSQFDHCHWEIASLNPLVEKFAAIAFHAVIKDPQQAELVFDLGEAPDIELCPQRLSRAITHLVRNACEAVLHTDLKGRVTLRTRSDGEWVQITIMDTGVGVPPELIEDIFSPFVTSKEHHIGLGLSVCYDVIVNEHEGALTVDSKPGETIFTIQLPLRKSQSMAAQAEEPTQTAASA